MRNELNLVKKLKKGIILTIGTITLEDYKLKMKEIEGDLFDEDVITAKTITGKKIKI